jgi:hypothetical protein
LVEGLNKLESNYGIYSSKQGTRGFNFKNKRRDLVNLAKEAERNNKASKNGTALDYRFNDEDNEHYPNALAGYNLYANPFLPLIPLKPNQISDS